MYTLLTSHVYIMVTLLIVPRVASQYFFVRTVDFLYVSFFQSLVCLQLVILVYFSYKALLLRITAIIWSCQILYSGN